MGNWSMVLKALGCSEPVFDRIMGPSLYGSVHSVFESAANLVLLHDCVLSLNACDADYTSLSFNLKESDSFLLSNGIVLGAHAGAFPFNLLSTGMRVGAGGGRLWIDELDLSLDLSTCLRWDPQVYCPTELDRVLLKTHGDFLELFCDYHRPYGAIDLLPAKDDLDILELTRKLSGRGPGLTPAGDDFLLGWLATGWLLYGSQSTFADLCRSVVELARERTHVLSLCWLTDAALGRVSYALKELLEALTFSNRVELELRAKLVLVSGATSGFDTLQGVIYAVRQL